MNFTELRIAGIEEQIVGRQWTARYCSEPCKQAKKMEKRAAKSAARNRYRANQREAA